MRNFKVWAGIVVVMVGVVIGGSALAYDLPCVIGEFRYEQSPTDWNNIRDQNGDGKDDLLIDVGYLRRHEVYLGRDSFKTEPDYLMPSQRGESEVIGFGLSIGRLTPEHPHCFANWNIIRNDSTRLLDFYKGAGNGMDSLWMTLHSNIYRDNLAWAHGRYLRPFDFNGDGYHDILLKRQITDNIGALELYFGGADFDTIPDWVAHFNISDMGGFTWSPGYDINHDGFADILVRGYGAHDDNQGEMFYSLYLGGGDPDTTPVFILWNRSFQGRWGQPTRMEKGFSLLPDVNSDGYADFGIYWHDGNPNDARVSRDGVYLFFGGEQVDAVPDLNLEGSRGCAEEGRLIGGDFNGDGKGDVAVGYWARPPTPNGEVHFHFGSQRIDTVADVVVSENDYQGRYPYLGYDVGAVGDYNGDGADDIGVATMGDFPLIILTGNRDWQVEVKPEPSIPIKAFSFTLAPNPSNPSVTIKFALLEDSKVRLTVYDLAGREVMMLVNDELKAGNHSATWSAGGFTSGIYLVKMETPSFCATKKVALVK